MNVLIILSFILIIGSSIVLLSPRRVALRICGINRYDLETVPTKIVLLVYVVAIVILVVFMGVLIYELKDITSTLPPFLEDFIEWING